MLVAAANVVVAIVVAAVTIIVVIVLVADAALAFVLRCPLVLLLHRLAVAFCLSLSLASLSCVPL
jgi:hypothetical protein